MKKRIIIPYHENKDLHILIALSKIKDYSDMKFEEIGPLRDLFNKKKDIYCDISTETLEDLLNSLTFSGFFYKLEEIL